MYVHIFIETILSSGYNTEPLESEIEYDIGFELRVIAIVKSLFEQSLHYLHVACMWLRSMLKLQIGQILSMSKSDQSGVW